MKKRLLHTMIATVLLATILCMTGCGLFSSSKKNKADDAFAYSSCDVGTIYSSLKETMDFVYYDTSLYLFSDGTWVIDMNDATFIGDPIDKGTYIVEDGLYTFIGFEFGFETTGKKNGDKFEIYFKDPTDISENAFVLYFEK